MKLRYFFLSIFLIILITSCGTIKYTDDIYFNTNNLEKTQIVHELQNYDTTYSDTEITQIINNYYTDDNVDYAFIGVIGTMILFTIMNLIFM